MTVRQIKELVREYNLGISPRRLGQHFLVQPRILDRIVGMLEATEQDHVLEIGAGLGALTEALLLGPAAHVTAVEQDRRFVRVLSDRFRDNPKLQLLQGDILRLNWASLAGEQPRSLLVIGNIPYSMTSHILERLVEERRWIKRAVLTLQKEVAQRIVARPGTKAYSSLTLLVAVAFDPAPLRLLIAPGAFYPQPRVTSAVLRLDPLAQSVVPDREEEWILKLIRKLFLHRRKTLANALITSQVVSDKKRLLETFARIGMDPTRRPETLTLEEVVALQRGLTSELSL